MKLPPSLPSLFAILSAAVLQAAPVKVACVGDSITAGSGTQDPVHQSYPAVLGELLGTNYEVRNFGVGGATMLKKGNKPYWNQPAFKEALAFEPNIVIIMLGTNDSKPLNWEPYGKDFRADYEAMIAQFAKLPSISKIFVCLPVPAFKVNYGIREAMIAKERPQIEELAAARKLAVIDLDTPLKEHGEWFPDGIHPNELGAAALAKSVAQALRK